MSASHALPNAQPNATYTPQLTATCAFRHLDWRHQAQAAVAAVAAAAIHGRHCLIRRIGLSSLAPGCWAYLRRFCRSSAGHHGVLLDADAWAETLLHCHRHTHRHTPPLLAHPPLLLAYRRRPCQTYPPLPTHRSPLTPSPQSIPNIHRYSGQEDTPEINWQYFRTKYLETGRVERLVVANKSVVKVPPPFPMLLTWL